MVSKMTYNDISPCTGPAGPIDNALAINEEPIVSAIEANNPRMKNSILNYSFCQYQKIAIIIINKLELPHVP